MFFRLQISNLRTSSVSSVNPEIELADAIRELTLNAPVLPDRGVFMRPFPINR